MVSLPIKYYAGKMFKDTKLDKKLKDQAASAPIYYPKSEMQFVENPRRWCRLL
jgi:hypothetical protein